MSLAGSIAAHVGTAAPGCPAAQMHRAAAHSVSATPNPCHSEPAQSAGEEPAFDLGGLIPAPISQARPGKWLPHFSRTSREVGTMRPAAPGLTLKTGLDSEWKFRPP